MQMVSRKDLNSAELDTVRVSKNPTTVLTANGEVRTKAEATVYVRELDLFVTAGLLEDTLAVLSLGKLCEDHSVISIGPVTKWQSKNCGSTGDWGLFAPQSSCPGSSWRQGSHLPCTSTGLLR